MNTLEKTRKIINEYNIKANKKFGQNFLIDDSILEKIVEVADIQENDLILEIGPGLGNLTEYILKKSNYAILIEIDSKMEIILKNRFSNFHNYKLINEDILKINIDDFIEKIEKELNKKFQKVKVVANLPYYITTPILFKLLQESKRINEIIVMIQKEVAERMVAKNKSKEYGILTLMVDYLSDANICFLVPNDSFIPKPEVTSAVIKLVKNKKYNVKEEKLFFEFIHSAFAQRRKKIVNSLESKHFRNMTKEELNQLLEKLGYSLNTRAEELTIQDYIKIVNAIGEENGNE